MQVMLWPVAFANHLSQMALLDALLHELRAMPTMSMAAVAGLAEILHCRKWSALGSCSHQEDLMVAEHVLSRRAS